MLVLARDVASQISVSCNASVASTGRSMSVLWPAETGTDFLTMFLKCHLFQNEEEKKFRNVLTVVFRRYYRFFS